MRIENLDNKKILKFWSPLAATWIMMAIEAPFIAAIIARLPSATFNLAAFGVAYSFAVLLEAPVIMLMSTSTALADNKANYLKLLKFTRILNSLMTLLFMIFLIPGVFDFITLTIIGLPAQISALTYKGMLVLIPWPAAIGFRRFLQGILIRNNQTKKVTYGTFVRLTVMILTTFILFRLKIEGILIGTGALSAGVLAEAVACWIMSRSTVRLRILNSNETNSHTSLSYKEIYKFYYPLALTTLLSLGVHPTVTFFMSKSRMPIESLAVLPVINSLIFLFRSIALSYQEVGIALNMNQKKQYLIISTFARNLGIILFILPAAIMFTPLAKIWFYNISGLSMELTNLALLPARILVLMPLFSTWLSFQRSILVVSKHTHLITKATGIEIVLIIITLFFTISIFNIIGVICAAVAYVVGRIGANFYLLSFQRKFKQNLLKYDNA